MTPDDSPIARDVLSQDEAVARARLVSGISYEIHLDLVAGASAYRGDVTIRFDYASGDDGAAGVFLDHRGGGIERIEVNGESLQHQPGRYRIALMVSAPDLPEELINGKTIVELDNAMESAKKIVEKVASRIGARAPEDRVPSGAPARRQADLSGLSAREKILYAINKS